MDAADVDAPVEMWRTNGRVSFNFVPDGSGEIDARAGEACAVALDQGGSPEGWLLVSVERGDGQERVGYVPASYVTFVEEEFVGVPAASQGAGGAGSGSSGGPRSAADGGVGAAAGAALENSVSPAADASSQGPPMGTDLLATVSFPFRGEAEGELSVDAGDSVWIVPDQSRAPTGWVFVRRQVRACCASWGVCVCRMTHELGCSIAVWRANWTHVRRARGRGASCVRAGDACVYVYVRVSVLACLCVRVCVRVRVRVRVCVCTREPLPHTLCAADHGRRDGGGLRARVVHCDRG